MTAPTATLGTRFLFKNLVSGELWERLVGRIVKDHDFSRGQAERIADATLGFLKLCAEHPGHRFVPSKLVDIGWHTFLLYTRGYQEFCRENGNRFIHHEPNDRPGIKPKTGGVRATVEFMRENGISFDPKMWAGVADKCATDDCRDDCWWCSKVSDDD